METRQVRGIYMLFAIGGALIVFARRFAYWLDWEPRTVRIIGIAVLVAGILGVAGVFGPGTAAIAGLVSAASVAGYLWSDIQLERAELEQQARDARAAAGIDDDDE